MNSWILDFFEFGGRFTSPLPTSSRAFGRHQGLSKGAKGFVQKSKKHIKILLKLTIPIPPFEPATSWSNQNHKKTLCFTFQMNFTKIYKILKYWPWSTMAIMASTRPFKKAYKTLLILLFLTMRPPEDLIWALDVNMRINQKWATCYSEKSLFREWSSFWIVRACI